MANCETAINAEKSIADKDSLKLRVAGVCSTVAEAKGLKAGRELERERMRVLTEMVVADRDVLACLKSLNGNS